MEAGELGDVGLVDEVEVDPGAAVELPCSCKPEVHLKQGVLI